MTININGEEKRIGLSLSGGGFRAVGFHLGVFRKLHQLGILWNIDLLSCVSGGSIAGAFIATRWGDVSVLDDLEHYLATKTIDIGTTLGGILNPFESRIGALASSYDKDLFSGKKLNDIKDGPRIYLNTTNLATGNMFFFVAGDGGLSEMGEHELGQVEAPDFPIAKAVAASSAFPPVYPPLKLDKTIYNVHGVEYVALTDGGVYDNLGINPLLRTARNNLEYAITSDAGKPFDIDETPTESSAAVLKESINILMEQVRGQQFQRLLWQHKAGAGPKPIWFSIDSKEGEISQDDAAFASSIPTRLKKLNQHQRSVLIRHAGALLEARLNRYAPEIVG
jgi:NTE family protein